MSSFKVEVIADSSGKWCGNMLRFRNEADAATYARDLSMRWTAVLSSRVVPCEDEAKHRWDEKRGAVDFNEGIGP